MPSFPPAYGEARVQLIVCRRRPGYRHVTFHRKAAIGAREETEQLGAETRRRAASEAAAPRRPCAVGRTVQTLVCLTRPGDGGDGTRPITGISRRGARACTSRSELFWSDDDGLIGSSANIDTSSLSRPVGMTRPQERQPGSVSRCNCRCQHRRARFNTMTE
jgi:hypothetical protein